MSVNKVILVGNVGKDPEVRYLESGISVSKFSLATSETYKNKQGEKDDTGWIVGASVGKLKEKGDLFLKVEKRYIENDAAYAAMAPWRTPMTGAKQVVGILGYQATDNMKFIGLVTKPERISNSNKDFVYFHLDMIYNCNDLLEPIKKLF